MDISEVRVKLIPNPHDRLKAFASVTLDRDFVVRDIKVIDGAEGIFVAMPSRKLADRCSKCKSKNHLRAKFCNECGQSLAENRIVRDKRGRTKLHADIAHPINSECRQRLQERIVEAYAQEVIHSEEPGYQPVTDDEYDDANDAINDEIADANTDVDSDPHPEIDETPADTADNTIDDTDSPQEDEADEAVDQPPVEESGGDYNSLIADLKRDAAQRSNSRSRGGRNSPSRPRHKTSEPKRQQPDTPPKPVARQKRPPKVAEKQPPKPVTKSADEPDDFGAGIV